MKDWQAKAFWQFSLATYAPNKAVYLALQDNFGLNVNLLLLCQFIASKGYHLGIEHIGALHQTIAKLDNQIQQHRDKRRSENNSQRRQQLLQKELELEKQQQEQLITCLNNLPVSSGDNAALDNLKCYLQLLLQPDETRYKQALANCKALI